MPVQSLDVFENLIKNIRLLYGDCDLPSDYNVQSYPRIAVFAVVTILQLRFSN